MRTVIFLFAALWLLPDAAFAADPDKSCFAVHATADG